MPRNADTAMIINTVICCRRGIADDATAPDSEVLTYCGYRDRVAQSDFGDVKGSRHSCRVTIYQQRTLCSFIVVVGATN
jgi:hypothetical protein